MPPDRYVCGYHAALRYQERTGTKLSMYHTAKEVEIRVSGGTIIREEPLLRYVEHGGLYFPCARRNDNIFLVKTVLTHHMMLEKEWF